MLTVDDWAQQIKLLRLMSIEMLELAQTGAWDEAIHWESQRRALLEALFQQTPPAELTPALVETVQAMLSSDAQLQALARVEMEKLSDYLKSIGQGRRARQAYQSL